MVKRALIMGAAGRDFHNFNVYFRDNPDYEVVAFTAAQVSELDRSAGIGRRVYPGELAGARYPAGIRIHPEEELEGLIEGLGVDEVFFAYSDVSHAHVMHAASRALASGASFTLLGPVATMLEARKPVVAVCAVRTGSGKSPTARWLFSRLRGRGLRVVVVRHPMPYGDLVRQRAQRFENLDDLDRFECTIEEREDIEPHLEGGAIVYAGVDYGAILKRAEEEEEADVIIWDGGNNDLPFYRPAVHIVLVDPHRAGHELAYHPGEANVRMADIAVVSKTNTADPEEISKVEESVRRLNPRARLVRARMAITAEEEDRIRGRRVLAVEDGPTLTHGELGFGAATIKAKELGADVIDPRPYARGSIAEVYRLYPHIGAALPAVGYSRAQMEELSRVIDATPCDLVLLGTPTDLRRYLKVRRPVLRVRYEFQEARPGELEEAVLELLAKRGG